MLFEHGLPALETWELLMVALLLWSLGGLGLLKMAEKPKAVKVRKPQRRTW